MRPRSRPWSMRLLRRHRLLPRLQLRPRPRPWLRRCFAPAPIFPPRARSLSLQFRQSFQLYGRPTIPVSTTEPSRTNLRSCPHPAKPGAGAAFSPASGADSKTSRPNKEMAPSRAFLRRSSIGRQRFSCQARRCPISGAGVFRRTDRLTDKLPDASGKRFEVMVRRNSSVGRARHS
jgi:hypothetical protein